MEKPLNFRSQSRGGRTRPGYRGTRDARCFRRTPNRCLAINTKLPKLARHILRYLREHPEAQDTIEGITVWWVSERAIKQWLPQVRKALAALVTHGYLEKHTAAGNVFYRLPPSQRSRIASRR
jgi:Fe2+ or Zn2+ uptake regulation protein